MTSWDYLYLSKNVHCPLLPYCDRHIYRKYFEMKSQFQLEGIRNGAVVRTLHIYQVTLYLPICVLCDILFVHFLLLQGCTWISMIQCTAQSGRYFVNQINSHLAELHMNIQCLELLTVWQEMPFSPPPWLSLAEDWAMAGVWRFRDDGDGLGARGGGRYRGNEDGWSHGEYIFGRPQGR